jgi:hypothetical protein
VTDRDTLRAEVEALRAEVAGSFLWRRDKRAPITDAQWLALTESERSGWRWAPLASAVDRLTDAERALTATYGR